MAITKKDREEIAKMIARSFNTMRSVRSTTSNAPMNEFLRRHSIMVSAQEKEVKWLYKVRAILISNYNSDSDTSRPYGISKDIKTIASIVGECDGYNVDLVFPLKDTDEEISSELKRIQNHPHLYKMLNISFAEDEIGEYTIDSVHVLHDIDPPLGWLTEL